ENQSYVHSEHGPAEEMEEALFDRLVPVHHGGVATLQADERGPDDSRHEVARQEVRDEIREEHLLVQEAARWGRWRESKREEAEDDEEPGESREHEGEERQDHEARIQGEDAEARPREVGAPRKLRPEAR